MCTVFPFAQLLLCLKSKLLQYFQLLTIFNLLIFCSKTLLTDPTDEEENLCGGMLHIVLKDEELCSVLKPGGSPLNDEVLFDCITNAKLHARHVNTLIDTALKDIK